MFPTLKSKIHNGKGSVKMTLVFTGPFFWHISCSRFEGYPCQRRAFLLLALVMLAGIKASFSTEMLFCAFGTGFEESVFVTVQYRNAIFTLLTLVFRIVLKKNYQYQKPVLMVLALVGKQILPLLTSAKYRFLA